jgi:release factor glutamine methyltransferase
MGHDDLRAAWAGGKDGMEVTSRFLPLVSRLLAPGGVCYLLLIQENNPVKIAREMAETYGLMPKLIRRKIAKNEHLSLWRYTHHKSSK